MDLDTLERFAEDREPAFGRFLRIFASPQIKNARHARGQHRQRLADRRYAALPLAAEAELELVSARGARRVPITGFYKGYKPIDLAKDELLARIRVPAPPSAENGRFVKLYKVSQRRDLDISAVNACFLGRVDEEGLLRGVRIAYGGVGPTAIRLPKTEAFLEGKRPSAETAAAAGASVRQEIAPISDARGSKDFRLKIAENLLRKCFCELEAEGRSGNALPRAQTAAEAPA